MKKEKRIKKRFLKSMKAGIGKAYFIQLEHPQIDFSKAIIKGATKNYAYDCQCEGSRAKYIYRLIRNAKQSAKIQKAVLKELLTNNDDWYNLDQMFDLAVLFHKNGNKKARKVIEKRFQKNALSDQEFVGEKQLIAINGIAGVLQVAELVGRQLLADEDDYETSWIVDRFQKKNKKMDVYAILEKESKNNIYVRKYLRSITENKVKRYKKAKAKPYGYQEIKQRIEEDRLMVISEEKAKELTKKEVKKLANDFILESNDLIREKYLRFFSVRKYPNDSKELLKIVSSPNPAKTRLVEFAAEALKYFKSAEVRQLALKKIKSTKNPALFLPLLAANYKPGDSRLLAEVVNRSDKQDHIHSLVYGLITIYSFNKTKECKGPLMTIYASMTCGIHRHDILRIMQANGVLDKAVLREMKYDSYQKNRELFKQIKHGS